MSYRNDFQQARQQPEAFLAEQARNVAWYQPPTRILETLDDGTHRWFGDGRLNTCYLALDHQVEQGRGEQDALIFDSPVTGVRQRFTYNQLLARVAELAGALTRLGVGAGDGVVIYMPMVPEAAMAMLACARIGAVHSVVFGGFAANELAVRIDDARPKVILTASCGIEIDRVIPYTPLVHGALRQCRHRVDQVLVLQRETARAELRQYGFLDWRATVDGSDIYELTPFGTRVSHVDWRDDKVVLFTSDFRGRGREHVIVTDQTQDFRLLAEGELNFDGHMTFSPDRRWLVTDKNVQATLEKWLLLVRLADEEVTVLHKFDMREQRFLSGDLRCDLHPRWNRSGNQVCVDAIDPNDGTRQLHIVSLSLG